MLVLFSKKIYSAWHGPGTSKAALVAELPNTKLHIEARHTQCFRMGWVGKTCKYKTEIQGATHYVEIGSQCHLKFPKL